MLDDTQKARLLISIYTRKALQDRPSTPLGSSSILGRSGLLGLTGDAPYSF